MMQRSSADEKRSAIETTPNFKRMQTLIQTSTTTGFVGQLLCDYPHTVFSNEELVYLIENDSVHKSVRHAAYLALCDGGELNDLKRLAPLMDFSYTDQDGHNAFLYAGIYNRPDVMSWLAVDVEYFGKINEQERTDIILYTAHNGSVECLRLIDKPKSEGGLGWDVNVKKRGCTPVTFAAQAGHLEMLKVLISSRDHGGCGLPVDKKSIRILGDAYKLGEFKNQQIKYRRKKLTRQASLIELASLDAGKSAIYKPVGSLGEGCFGRVRLFQDEKNPANTLAVKSVNFDSDSVEKNEYELLFTVLAIGLEMNFLKLAYPAESSYGIKVVSDQQGRLDYRAVMPVVSGSGLITTVINIIESPSQFAALVLSIIKEMHRLHELGIIHGDVNINNMLILKTDVFEYGLSVFKVNFIDFGSASNKNEDAATYLEVNLFTPPELVRDVNVVLLSHPSQDIYSLSHSLGLSLAFRSQRETSFAEVIDQQFPSIKQLCEKGVSGEPGERPALKNIIDSLTNELKQSHKKQNLNCFSNISASVRDMASLFKPDSGKKCDSMPAASVAVKLSKDASVKRENGFACKF